MINALDTLQALHDNLKAENRRLVEENKKLLDVLKIYSRFSGYELFLDCGDLARTITGIDQDKSEVPVYPMYQGGV